MWYKKSKYLQTLLQTSVHSFIYYLGHLVGNSVCLVKLVNINHKSMCSCHPFDFIFCISHSSMISLLTIFTLQDLLYFLFDLDFDNVFNLIKAMIPLLHLGNHQTFPILSEQNRGILFVCEKKTLLKSNTLIILVHFVDKHQILLYPCYSRERFSVISN